MEALQEMRRISIREVCDLLRDPGAFIINQLLLYFWSCGGVYHLRGSNSKLNVRKNIRNLKQTRDQTNIVDFKKVNIDVKFYELRIYRSP